MKVKKRAVATIALLFIGGFVAVTYLANSVIGLLDERFRSNAEDELRERVLLAKSNLESELFRDVFLVDSLATVFNIDPDNAAENFPEISSRLLDKALHVRNISMAPNDVIARVNPYQDNEKAIGLDFRTVPEQYTSVLAARERGDIYLAGPVNLVQGGRGLIARIPIFNDYPVNDSYWGTVSVVIDYDQLVAATGLLAIDNATVAIRGINGSGAQGAIFEGNAAQFVDPDYEGKLIVPNGEWWVAAEFYPELTANQQRFLLFARWSTVAVYLLLFGLFTSLWAVYRAERQRANEDVLTGMFNRRFALNYLEQRFTAKSTNQRFCVMVIDLNDFKAINDNFGHAIGDAVLQGVSKRLLQAVRSADIVARMGGDEFLIILNRMKSTGDTGIVVKKLRAIVEDQELVIDSVPFKPSLSIGTACSDEQFNSLEHMLKTADTRMYEDKEAHRASL